MAKVHLKTLGCRLNQAESERMARGFKLAGHEIVDLAEEADVRVVNSCTVTAEAGRDSRKAAKALVPNQRIVVTGCHSQMHPEDFAQADLLIDNDEKESLAALVMEKFGMEGIALGMDMRVNTTPQLYPLTLRNTRAFVKIQDGCNMTCSFCLTTLARGISRSRSANDIIQEIHQLTGQGCQEVVLTGVHAGSYGLDLNEDLGWLIDRILTETDLARLRLSSLEPWNFKPNWMKLWKTHGDRLCRHLHMSLQSGSDSVLPRMHRSYNTQSFKEKIDLLKSTIPGIAITTDIIVAFPQESDAEHADSLAFIKEMQFAGAHVFAYSQRAGTKAAQMEGQIPRELKRKRFAEMKALTDASEQAFYNQQASKDLKVLWEAHDKKGQSRGITDNYLRVIDPTGQSEPNTFQLLSGGRLDAEKRALFTK